MRLLILDDDAATGRLVGRTAAAAGFTPEITTGTEAFQQAYEAAVPDAITLDLQLGQSDGIEQLRFLSKKHFPYAVILLSGFDSRVLATAAELGRNQGLQVAAALAKPIDVAELRSVLQRVHEQTAPVSCLRLQQALDNDEIFLEYQPIVGSSTRRLHRFEALARWRHPELGRLEPGRFIAFAEESPALATAFAERVISIAARDYKHLQAFGIAVPVAVNLSPRCLLDLSFPDILEALLRRHGMPPDRLCLEITESAAFQSELQTLDILTRIRLKGIKLAIDDFGTGYSSLKLLRQMPFSTLKIDRSFVRDVVRSQDARAIIKSVVDLAEALDLESIAEGIETEETAEALVALKVGFLQGYLIGRPVGFSQIAVWADPRQRNPAATADAPAPVSANQGSTAAQPVAGQRAAHLDVRAPLSPLTLDSAERASRPANPPEAAVSGDDWRSADRSSAQSYPLADAMVGRLAERRASAPTATALWKLDGHRRELRAPDGAVVRLTSTEFEALAYLMAREGEVVSRDAISTAVLRRNFSPLDRSVDNLIARIRIALKPHLGDNAAIKSIRSLGYVFVGFDAPASDPVERDNDGDPGGGA